MAPSAVSARHWRRNLGTAARIALDIVLSVSLLILLSPVLLAVALAVTLDDGGPVLFRQERLGCNRNPFTVLKFRTMSVTNDDALHRDYVRQLLVAEVAPHGGVEGVYKLAADPRVTRVGRFLRQSSLDELPQLLNVARGQMALVGPRPVLAYEAAFFPHHVEPRFSVLPGLTGLWQVEGRGTVGMRAALEMDLEYVRRRSIGYDLLLVLRTLRVLFGRSVTR